MHCVYWAYELHLRYLGVRPSMLDWAVYCTLKRMTHGTLLRPTLGSMAPFIVGAMAATHGLSIEVQTVMKDRKVFLEEAASAAQRWVINRTTYSTVERVTMETGIRMCNANQHAYFGVGTTPAPFVMMGIHIGGEPWLKRWKLLSQSWSRG